MFAGMKPLLIAIIALAIEHMLEAASACPMFDFTEPTRSADARFSQNISTALISSRSPAYYKYT